MISVVICSAQAARLQAVASNIASTIGSEYELIALDNSVEGRGLCEVYNEGASRASHEFICFVHEDVEFLSSGWGQLALSHFAGDAELAMIGLAGSRYKARVPSGWHSGDEQDLCINVRHGASREVATLAFAKPDAHAAASCVPVVALDGVWMFVRRSAWAASRFDERLRGFHFYDVDFSLRVSQVGKVAVVFDIDLLHFSLGSFREAWALHALAYAQDPPFPMPLHNLSEMSSVQIRRKEALAVRYWLRLLRRAQMPLSIRLRWLAGVRIRRYPSLWRLALKFLLR
ncbi:Glycosyltransferase like family protein [Pseudomonas flavescens]|uniref:Glycosyltransferase like family protein n=1 Tax=Phytopseudomonas flavescens TaxID=29435 RepID=A0A1G8PCE8_9GAMM|nr:glycosyltransferase [Pseudomonas flavescens]SDI90122.1 Glycosyltransferase like family protein [Pseudomonas flavescens]